MQTVVRAGARELIAYAFYDLGYRPRESLVLVGVQGLPGGRERTHGCVLRVDLPAAPAAARELAAGLAGYLRSVGQRRVVALVLSAAHDAPRGESTAGEGAGGARPAHAGLVDDLTRILRRSGVVVSEALAVGSSSYRSYRCARRGCCPPGGRPLGDLSTTAVAAAMVVAGQVLHDDEQGLVLDVDPEGTDRGAPADRAVLRAPDADQAAAGPGDALAALARWRALTAPPPSGTGSAAVRPGPGHDPDLRWLEVALRAVEFRDALILTLVPGSGSAAEGLLSGPGGHAGDAASRRLLDRAPDPALLERGRVPLAHVARTAPPGHRAQALAVLAWMAWWSGAGARARLLARRALEDEPGHRMALVLDQLLLRGVPPAWALREAAS